MLQGAVVRRPPSARSTCCHGIVLTTSHAYPAPIPEAAAGHDPRPGSAPATGPQLIWCLVIVGVFHVRADQDPLGPAHRRGRRQPARCHGGGHQGRRIKIGNFMMTSVLGAFAGIMEAFRVNTIDPNLGGGTGIMFTAISAAVIGGTALAGGSGTVIGALLGALVLAELQNGFNLIGISANPLLPDPRRRDRRLDDRQPVSVQAAPSGPDVTAPAAPPNGRGPPGRARRQAVRRGDRPADVNLRLARGEVLGLIGDNGAGKSTLIKIICGFHQPDAGRILVDGEEVVLQSVDHARTLGIDTVYQDLALVNELSVYHNMFLNRELVRWPLLQQPRDAAAGQTSTWSRWG